MENIERVNGVKVIKKWNLGLIFSLFLMLISIGLVIAFYYFLPLFSLNLSTGGDVQTFSISGLDFIYFLLKDFIGNQYVSNDFWTFEVVLTNLVNSLPLRFAILYTIAILLVINALFAVITAIIFLCGLIFGVIHGWKAPKVMVWLVFTFQTILAVSILALKLCFIFMLPGTAYGGATIAYADISMWFLIGTVVELLIFGIILSIIYHCCFKDRIYIKDAKRILRAQKERMESMQQMGYPYPVMGVAPMIVPNAYPINGQIQTVNNKPVTADIRPNTSPTIVTQVKYTASKGLPEQISSIGGHAFSQNANLEIAIIPLGIKEIGPSAFSNCPNLKVVSIPTSVTKIGYNAFFGCKKLARINYGGRKNEWKNIVRGSNWLASAGTTIVVCVDGAITVNPYH